MKFLCVVCFKIGKEVTANCDGVLCKDASGISLSRNLVRSIIVLFAVRMGIWYQRGARGVCAESASGKNVRLKNE